MIMVRLPLGRHEAVADDHVTGRVRQLGVMSGIASIITRLRKPRLVVLHLLSIRRA